LTQHRNYYCKGIGELRFHSLPRLEEQREAKSESREEESVVEESQEEGQLFENTLLCHCQLVLE
jgi:hypothetical protein